MGRIINGSIEVFMFALCERCEAVYIVGGSGRHHGLIAICGAIVNSSPDQSVSYRTFICNGKIRSVDPHQQQNLKALTLVAESLYAELDQT